MARTNHHGKYGSRVKWKLPGRHYNQETKWARHLSNKEVRRAEDAILDAVLRGDIDPEEVLLPPPPRTEGHLTW